MGSCLFMITLLLLSLCIDCKEKTALECIVNQYKQISCLWNQHGIPSENYSLYYWFGNLVNPKASPCPQYILDGNTNIGCWFNNSVETFQSMTAVLNSSSLNQPIKKHYERLQDQVKLDPPYDLHVGNTSSLELILKWEPSLGKYPLHCVHFQVQHRSTTSAKWTEKIALTKQFSLPSFDPEKTYVFQVRSKLNDICSNAKMWSDWSPAVTWGGNFTIKAHQPLERVVKSVIIYLVSSIVLLTFLVALVRVERIWVIFVPRIPNPGKKFEELFSTYGGDFQEWIGVSKEIVDSLKHNYSEPLCTVSEDTGCNATNARNPITI
ncbi:cytokine receptor common subunit gamma [Spea bombifrons]|uniref:cytokine receptor common subunit gamma n=1 Tax=Spea bombifrons TaxID=233779 RepID=UPI00234A29B6|nr:cytokine receptor common subunit gamma [Spea bombifrons]